MTAIGRWYRPQTGQLRPDKGRRNFKKFGGSHDHGMAEVTASLKMEDESG